MPPKGYSAINLFTFVFTKDEKCLSKTLLYHEQIHSKQIKELFFIFFYVFYFVEFFIKLLVFRNWDKAYRNVSFEKEAYENQNNFNYMQSRKRFAWIKYL